MLRNEKLDLTKAINTYRAAEAERNKPKSLKVTTRKKV